MVNLIADLVGSSEEVAEFLGDPIPGTVLKIEIQYPQILETCSFKILGSTSYLKEREKGSFYRHYGLNIYIRIAGDEPTQMSCHIPTGWECCDKEIPESDIIHCDTCPRWYCSPQCLAKHHCLEKEILQEVEKYFTLTKQLYREGERYLARANLRTFKDTGEFRISRLSPKEKDLNILVCLEGEGSSRIKTLTIPLKKFTS